MLVRVVKVAPETRNQLEERTTNEYGQLSNICEARALISRNQKSNN